MTDKLEILEKIEMGEISPEEGTRLLSEANSNSQNSPAKTEKENEMQILELIEKGDLSLEDGLDKLQGTNEPIQSDENSSKASTTINNKSVPISEDELQKWRNWWTIPVFIGFTIVILSASWMNSAYESSGVSFWFLFSWIPLLLGIATMALSWPSPNRTWIHIRVKQAKGQTPKKIAISIPIPLNIISWGLRVAKKYGPEKALSKLDDTAIDELILGLGNSVSTGTPFHIEVDEGDNGEKVEIYFG